VHRSLAPGWFFDDNRLMLIACMIVDGIAA